MIKSIIENMKSIFSQLQLEPALKSVKYGFSGSIPATDQPCLFFNISKIERVEILANSNFSAASIVANIEIVLFTSVLTNPENAAKEAQKYLWQYSEKGEDIGIMPFLLNLVGEVLFTDKKGRAWQLSEVGEFSIFGANNAANARGALRTIAKIRCLI